MKSLIFIVAVGLTFLQSSIAQQQLPVANLRSVAWGDVPDAVKRTLRSQSGAPATVGVLQGDINGQVVYVGRFHRDGRLMEVPVKADGSYYTAQDQVAWNEIPTAVQTHYQTMNNVADVQSVTRQSSGGHTIYVFSIRNNDKISKLRFGEDGTFLGTLGEIPMPVSAAEVAWRDLPPGVQKSAVAQAGTAQIASVKRATLQNQPIYEVTAIDQAGKQRMQFRLAEDGTVFGGATITEAAGSARPAGITSDQLTPRVQATMRTYTGAEEVQSIQPTFVNGQLCYEISFRKNGQPMTICVAEDGGIVK